MKHICALCGKEFTDGNRPDGIPNGIGLVGKNGKQVDVCAECVETIPLNAEAMEKLKSLMGTH